MEQIKDFQKRNKMSMQYLLMDKEKKSMRKLAQEDGKVINQMVRMDSSS